MNAKAFSIILESQSPSLIVCKTRAVAKFPTGNLGWTQLFMWCCVFVWKTAHRKGHSSEATHDCYIFYTQVCLFQTTMPLCKYAKMEKKKHNASSRPPQLVQLAAPISAAKTTRRGATQWATTVCEIKILPRSPYKTGFLRNASNLTALQSAAV